MNKDYQPSSITNHGHSSKKKKKIYINTQYIPFFFSPLVIYLFSFNKIINMANLYPFASALDSLVFDTVVDNNKPSAIETEANLALWVKLLIRLSVKLILY